jgi:hypothetical protein
MPGQFTHIYAVCRVAVLLAGEITDGFARPADGNLGEDRTLDPARAAEFVPAQCTEIMNAWPKT